MATQFLLFPRKDPLSKAKLGVILLLESLFHLLGVLTTVLPKSLRISHHALQSTWQPGHHLIHRGNHKEGSVSVALLDLQCPCREGRLLSEPVSRAMNGDGKEADWL